MSYRDFSEKYRPKSPKRPLIGDEQIKLANNFIELIKEKRCPQKIFMGGESGFGKTTLARIIAWYIIDNFESQYSTDHLYESCVYEIDCKGDNSKDSVRQIKERMNHKNIYNSPTIYILDEFQGYKIDAITVWLKILEPVPQNVYIIATTTEYDKLLSLAKTKKEYRALLSRFENATYELSPASNKEIIALINYIARDNGISLDKNIIEDILIRANKNIRSAVLLMEAYVNGIYQSSILKQEKEKYVDFYNMISKQVSIKKVLSELSKIPKPQQSSVIYSICSKALTKIDEKNAKIIIKHFGDFSASIRFDINFARTLVLIYEELND